MKRSLFGIVAGMASSVAGAQDGPIDNVQAIIEERVDVVTADYGRILYPADLADHILAVEMLEQHTRMLFVEGEEDGRRDLDPRVCRSHAIVMGLQAARQAGSYAAYRADLDQALAWHAEILEEHAILAQAAADDASTPLSAELAHRAHWDQVWRHNFGLLYMNGMPSGGADFIKVNMALAESCETDTDNVRFITGVLSELDWPAISTHGAAADENAWLLVQHASADLQAEILPRLERLWRAGETNPRNYAMLHDRVMTGRGLPQRYGSQYHCAGGQWVLMETEDMAGLDERRAAMGMNSVAENSARFEGRTC